MNDPVTEAIVEAAIHVPEELLSSGSRSNRKRNPLVSQIAVCRS